MKLSYLGTLGRIGAFFSFFGVNGKFMRAFCICWTFKTERCLLSLYVICFISAVGFRKSWVDCSVSQVLVSCLMTTDEEDLNMRGRWRQFFASAGWEKYVLNRSYKLEVDAT